MAQFQKGEVHNPKGRPLGSKNKNTTPVKAIIEKIVMDNIGSIADDLKELEPKDRVRAITDLAKIIVPRPISDDERDMVNEGVRRMHDAFFNGK
jgi:hypothetical protein